MIGIVVRDHEYGNKQVLFSYSYGCEMLSSVIRQMVEV